MNTPEMARDPLRYRLYYWMMNACFVGTIFVAAEHVFTRTTGGFEFEVYPTWYFAFGLTMLFLAFGLAPIVILARFMRDEYAELLWKRTANVVLYIITITPYALYIAAWTTYSILGNADFFPFNIELRDTHFRTAIYWVGTLVMGTFVIVFQFLRWKDSR